MVKGVPYDTPVAGYRAGTCNILRLWSAVADEEFDLDAFPGRRVLARGRGEDPQREPHQGALPERLEPAAASSSGSSSSTSSCRARCRTASGCSPCRASRSSAFADMFAIQLNDTHPALAVAELMRLLDRRARARLGRGVGHHAPHARVHQPHAPARGARDLAAAAVRSACCRATSRSSTRSTGGSSTRCAREVPGDDARAAARCR